MDNLIRTKTLLDSIAFLKPELTDFQWGDEVTRHIQEERYKAKLDMYSEILGAIDRCDSSHSFRWIKTSEMVPEEDEEVIIAVKTEQAGTYMHVAKWWNSRMYGEEDFCFLDIDGETYKMSEVPYWMPFPEFPEGV